MFELIIDHKWLQQKYLVEGMSTSKIAELVGCHRVTMWKKLKSLGLPLRQNERRYTLNERIFQQCDSAEKAYWLGFIMADGHVHKGRHFLAFQLAAKDKGHLRKFNQLISSNAPIGERTIFSFGKECTIAHLTIYSKQLTQDLAQFGVVPNKTGIETMSNIPINYARDFIRGYFDGDGWVSRGKRYILGMASASKVLICDIARWIHCQGISKKLHSVSFKNNCYSINFSGQTAKRLHACLYQDVTVFLERKKDAI